MTSPQYRALEKHAQFLAKKMDAKYLIFFIAQLELELHKKQGKPQK